MTKKEFNELISNKIIYLDGAMGSNLIKKGMPKGVCPEKWILENRQVVVDLQKDYVKAGSKILYTPTFTANSCKLKEYGLQDKLYEINHDLVAITKEAAANQAYVAGDITMTGILLKPMGPMDFEELISIYKEQVDALLKAGVDLFVVETMMSLQETRAAVIAIKETCDLPIMATLTFESDGKTLYGTDAKTAAVVLSSLSVDAIGTNCSTGPDKMVPIIEEMSKVTNIPIIAKPNAGIPFMNQNGETEYNNTPEHFAQEMEYLIRAGASLIGGCCGTTPEYISECYKKNFQYVKKEKTDNYYLSSERKTLSFSLDDSFIIVGERINPTGKKSLQEELRNGSFDKVIQFAEEQEKNGAKILDVNLGMSGIDEKAMMVRAIEELSSQTSLPLCIDTSHVDVMEEALRRYPGRALINSISFEKNKLEKLIPIAKKYGAAFILLPLSDKGLPENMEEKIDIIHKIAMHALSFGFTKKDIVVDGLVTTVGANKTAALETLATIQYCRQNGFATTCGLSNISFGLPDRSYINASFLTMAIQNGLTMAIANPNQDLLVSTTLACDLLRNKENADILYIEKMNSMKASQTNGAEIVVKSDKLSKRELLKEAILKGKRDQVTDLTQKVLDDGIDASEILNNVLITAINEVGELFEKGKYFLPQLIASAETMKLSIEILEPKLKSKQDKKEMPTVVIATVAGDIHDIGKNLVSLMLSNYGFRVIDLGKDVKKELIIDTAIKEKAKIIALSALMTTTMREMDEVIKYAKLKQVHAKIIIGGAVITQDYADEIGADGYSKDAAEAVKCASKLLLLDQLEKTYDIRKMEEQNE